MKYAFAAVLAGLLSVPAAAQLDPVIPTGSHIRIAPTALEKEESGEVRKAFAACMYRRNPEGASKLLHNSDPVHTDFEAAKINPAKVVETFSMSSCLGKQAGPDHAEIGMKFSPKLLRSLLLEEAYLATHKSLPTTAMLPAPRRFVSGPDQLPLAQAMAEFADCAVGNDPHGADRLLRTKPESPQERAAAQAMAPSLGACLTAGQKLTLNPATIRVFAADGLWHRYVVGSPAGQASR